MKGNSSIILTHDVMPNVEVLIKKKHIYSADTDSVIERHFYEIFYFGIKVGINQFFRVANDEEAMNLHWFFAHTLSQNKPEILPKEIAEEIIDRYFKVANLQAFTFENIGIYDIPGITLLPRLTCGEYFIDLFLKSEGLHHE